jgi:hypothetical protein
MSALGFGGLGSALFAGMREFERQEDRDTVKKDREDAKRERTEERDYLRQQREYQAGQQKRTLDDQSREDKARQDFGSVATTEDIDDPSWTPAPAPTNPVAQVTIGDDGSETVTPGQAPQQAPKITRQRNKDDIMADYAKIARNAGKLDLALKFDEQAAAESMKRGKALFSQWSASTPDTGNLEEAIKQAAQIYNGDRLPGQVQGYKMNPDGSAVVNIKNTSTGQTVPVTFKNVAELKQTMEGYYSPETLDAHRKSLREAAVKRQEELLKPYTLRPGEKRQVMGLDGKVITIGEGNLPKGYELATDEAGNTVMRPSATAGKTTTGKAPKTLPDEASEYLKDAMGGKGDGSPEGAARYTRAQSYVDGIYATNPNLSPRTASAIAADAAADPSKVTLQLNNRTGLVSKVYSNPDFEGGKPFELGPNSGSVAEMEKLKGKAGMAQSVNGMVADLASNFAPEQQDAFRTQLLKAATDPVARKAALDAAKANGQDVQVMTRQLDLIKTYAAPAPQPEKRDKQDKDVGGLALGKFKGLSGKALQDAVTADLREKVAANRPNAERLVKARADAAADPDLKRLDAERASALRAGRPVDANAKIAEANALRKERYGL